MRIVSLVPAATEIAFALGLGPWVVAATHDSDHPPAARSLPTLTRSTIPAGATQQDIDRAVRDARDAGESTFHLDGDALRTARADLILGQTLCAVCAVTMSEAHLLAASGAAVVPLDGTTIAGVLADIARVADAAGVAVRGAELIAALRARLARVAAAVEGLDRPRVVCLEWFDPLFNAGHWVPEQVTFAGGADILARPGVPSIDIAWDEVRHADPDVLILMPCGFDAVRAAADTERLRRREGWAELRAVRNGRTFAVDGNAYFSRPGPRLFDGVELLASLLHPGVVEPPRQARAIAIR